MGVGDLNLLKSWNPHLVKNQKKVWEVEQNLLNEEKKIRERQLEIKKEKELQELTSLDRNPNSLDTHDDRNTKRKNNGLEWMYNDPTVNKTENNKNNKQETEDDDMLLGKKNISLKTSSNLKKKKKFTGDINSVVGTTTPSNHTSNNSKTLSDDPMKNIVNKAKFQNLDPLNMIKSNTGNGNNKYNQDDPMSSFLKPNNRSRSSNNNNNNSNNINRNKNRSRNKTSSRYIPY
ncbi:uncharacterized protein SCODWIG_00248 [Saccharomycodes ludwigii]|uniref:Pre-mRNA-splicing factor CWC25 n=1 Tax=Saccharomycodes ludwigii TaxID=36035 RepID=A0A376B1E3_9ASCO|nr:uncharacterized protein SCODWIG_00248 [Saccharomycodes ludwigii]